jgi:hypothetical protein
VGVSANESRVLISFSSESDHVGITTDKMFHFAIVHRVFRVVWFSSVGRQLLPAAVAIKAAIVLENSVNACE